MIRYRFMGRDPADVVRLVLELRGKLGFIEYNGDLKIHDSLMSVVLHE